MVGPQSHICSHYPGGQTLVVKKTFELVLLLFFKLASESQCSESSFANKAMVKGFATKCNHFTNKYIIQLIMSSEMSI